jgi:hypothetical protein
MQILKILIFNMFYSVFIGGITTHVIEALYSIALTGLNGPWYKWSFQTFLVGFRSMNILGKQLRNKFASSALNMWMLFFATTGVIFGLDYVYPEIFI